VTPSGSIIIPISNLTPQTTHSLRQSILKVQSQNLLQRRPTQTVNLNSQSNRKPHSTAFPLSLSDCIHSPITNVTPQLSHLLSQSVFTTQTHISLYSRPTHSVSLYTLSNHKPYSTFVLLPPSVCIQSPNTNLTLELSHWLHQSLITAQSYTSFKISPSNSVSLY
jgi:hypothetical protein